MMHSTTQNKLKPDPSGTRTKEMTAAPQWLKILGAAAFWLLVWQLLASLVGQSVVLSPPAEVFGVLLGLLGQGRFWLTIGASFLRIGSGFLFGTGLGVLLAFLCFKSRMAAALIRPLMSVFKATPVASFIILLMFFARNQLIPGIIVSIMVCPIVWAAGLKGLEAADPQLLEMAKVFELSGRWKRRHIYGPSFLAYLLPAAVTAMGLAWKAGIAAEVLAAPPDSVGGMLYKAKIYLETPEMLAWTLCVILISMTLEKILSVLLMRIGRKGGAE